MKTKQHTISAMAKHDAGRPISNRLAIVLLLNGGPAVHIEAVEAAAIFSRIKSFQFNPNS
jgi:hypothetical protein